MTTVNPGSTPSNRPPITQVGPVAWLQKNLFSTWYNSLITILLGAGFLWFVKGFLTWATTTAEWNVITENFPLYFVGRYPKDQYWRLWVILGILASFSGLTWGVLARNIANLFNKTVVMGLGIAGAIAVLIPVPILFKLLWLATLAILAGTAWIGQQLGKRWPGLGKWLSFSWLIAFILIFWLIGGGFGLTSVPTSIWGGLLLTVFMAVTSILLCFPLGILLALGRQSNLPVLRILSVVFIEVVRGIPLISILFVGQVMVPLFLPAGSRPDPILRAIVGLTIFSAAYLAENVRGGLQSIPRGQTEAAKAVGLNTPLTLALIILPQALKVTIPAIVGQFIGLLQDTTLLSILGIVELLGISRNILANPAFLGDYIEVYLFDGLLFWIFCYAMSLGSRQLEKQLNTAHR